MDKVVATLDNALAKQGLSTKGLDRWKEEMPTEAEMLPKDKYTIFDRKARKYRKGIHSTLQACAFIGDSGGCIAVWEECA